MLRRADYESMKLPAGRFLVVLLCASSCGVNAGEVGQVDLSAPSIAELRAANRIDAPSGPIRLAYEFLEAPRLHQVVEVRVSAEWQISLHSLRGSVHTKGGLAVTPTSFSISDLSSRQTAEQVFRVTPFEEGPLRFSVILEGEVQGERQAAQLTVPVDIGTTHQEMQAAGVLLTDENGEQIISMPAQEP